MIRGLRALIGKSTTFPASWCAPSLRRDSERGDTLVEVLITLIIVSLAGLALMTSFSATISGSAQHRSLASNDVVLRAATEAAFSQIQQQASPTYDPCATSYLPTNASNWGAPSPDYTAAITSILYWSTSSNQWVTPAQYQTSQDCSTTYPPQLLTMTITASNGTTDSTQFVVDGRQVSAVAIGDFGVLQVTPSSLGQGAVLQTLAVTGFGFTSGASVSFSPVGYITVKSVNVTDANSITIQVTVGAGAPLGPYSIIVTNPDGKSATGTNKFNVVAAPTVSSFTPTSLLQGQTNATVTLTGTHYVQGAVVTFPTSGVVIANSVVNSTTQITVTIDVLPNASTGTGPLTVTNPDGSNGQSTGSFTVQPGVTISSPTSSSPCSVPSGSTGTCVITGTGFDSGSGVAITNASIQKVTFVSATELDVKVTATGVSGTSGDITVTNSLGVQATVTGGFVNG